MLYRCPKCSEYYTLNEASRKELSKINNNHPVIDFFVKCKCGNLHGVGGEYDKMPDGEIGISMFGFNGNDTLKQTKLTFPALMLEKTKNKNTDFATYEENTGVIYLQPVYVETIKAEK